MQDTHLRSVGRPLQFSRKKGIPRKEYAAIFIAPWLAYSGFITHQQKYCKPFIILILLIMAYSLRKLKKFEYFLRPSKKKRFITAKQNQTFENVN
jgi:hypothetical protein